MHEWGILGTDPAVLSHSEAGGVKFPRVAVQNSKFKIQSRGGGQLGPALDYVTRSCQVVDEHLSSSPSETCVFVTVCNYVCMFTAFIKPKGFQGRGTS